MSRSVLSLRLVVWLMGVLLMAQAAAAEESERIGLFVLDVRGAFPKYAERLDLEALKIQVPTHGLGIDLGAHVYPLRWKTVTFGIGGQFMTSRGSATPSADSPGGPGPAVETRFQTLAPQISFNFGHRQGYSYISGGIAKSSYDILSGQTVIANGPGVRLKTINYGAGARWFWNNHLAFCLDIRLYAINPNRAVGDLKGTPRMSLLVVSSGLSFH